MESKVKITKAAEQLVGKLLTQYAALVFHQSGGCCDGSSPMCYPEGELILDNTDILLGEVAGCKFYVSKSNLHLWEDYEITVDAVKGCGSSFSVEAPYGLRFLSRSKKCLTQV